MYYIGLDIGTSSLKTTLIDDNKHILHEASYDYVFDEPQEGWREIDPKVWFHAVKKGLNDIVQHFGGDEIATIGVSGQMHTTVFLDDEGNSVRPAIMWNDLRSVKEVEILRKELEGKEHTTFITRILSTGMPAVSTLWVKAEEAEHFSRIRKIMTPYDYIVYRLSGSYSADYCDASTSAMYDIAKKQWSSSVLDYLGIEESFLGPLHASCDVIGTLQPHLCKETGLHEGVRIIAGTGDNPANAMAMGILHASSPVISLGTSGVVIMPKADGDFDGKGKNVLFNADGEHFVNIVQGTVRSAGGTHKWWVKNIVESEDMMVDQPQISKDDYGHNKVLFFPHITGEKLLYHDMDVRGAFLGLSAHTKRKDMTQAVFEGVCFAIREVLEHMHLATWPAHIQINGGGARSAVWMQIMADILHAKMEVVNSRATPSYGAALLAYLSDHRDETDMETALQGVCYTPCLQEQEAYDRAYERYLRIYPALKDVM